MFELTDVQDRSPTLLPRPRTPGRVRAGFTIVELLVVIGIIAIVLLFGVPAFNSITRSQQLSKTQQLLNGALTRANVISSADRNLIAVRIFPADWHLNDDQSGTEEKSAEATRYAGRQMLTTYAFRTTAEADPSNPVQVNFHERFEPLDGGPTQIFPEDVWVAPAESLLDSAAGASIDGDAILRGTIGEFHLDAVANDDDFVDADDFLIVFDPQVGVLRASSNPQTAWSIKAFDPTKNFERAGKDWNSTSKAYAVPFQRRNYAGALIYEREPLVELGPTASGDRDITNRRTILRQLGQPYYVHRNGGNLVGGAAEPVEGS